MIDINEKGIREEVENRKYTLNVTENWLTPAGNQRSAPMYETIIENEYLKKTKRLKKKSVYELKQAVQSQMEKWDEQEIKKRIREAKKDAKEEATDLWQEKKEEIQDVLDELNNILSHTINFDDKLDWEELYDNRTFEDFTFDNPPAHAPKPVRKRYPREPIPPHKGIFDHLFPFLYNKKIERFEQEVSNWESQKEAIDKEHTKDLKEWEKAENSKKQEWEEKRDQAKEEYEKKRQEFLEAQKEKNEIIKDFKQRYEDGEAKAVVEYIDAVFERAEYPDSILVDHKCEYDKESNTLVVDISLPDIEEIPDHDDYKLKKTTGEITPVEMKKKDRETLYDSIINQIVVRSIHEVYESDYAKNILQVVLNGWVTYLDKATGNEKTSCIISVSADREKFEKINLERIDPAETIKSFKGVVAGSLSNISPVKPILKLNKTDRRFVESEEILADLNSTTNLAEIDWEEFEHLVRELFEHMFSSDDSEVKVTQASSDGGIDAIAFDPDPIRGGKFVIQAKRYTKVVPVSAVRDLYGTMISEGAGKGLLVTTAHFGRDTRSFIKDKPITLIDGANLVYLLEEYGYKVRINVDEARAKFNTK